MNECDLVIYFERYERLEVVFYGLRSKQGVICFLGKLDVDEEGIFETLNLFDVLMLVQDSYFFGLLLSLITRQFTFKGKL